MPPTPTRFIDQLPAVFRSDERDGDNFLGHFLRAFERVFAEVEGEIEAIPALFSLTPDPSLAGEAAPDHEFLRLDSAAGLRAGDVALLEPPGGGKGTLEFVVVGDRPPGLPPDAAHLSSPLARAHPRGTRLRLLGAEGKTATLAVAVKPPGEPREGESPATESELRIADAALLGIARGDALRLGGMAPEYLWVARVEGGAVWVRPPVARAHPAGTSVAVMAYAPRRTPPPAFAYAPRSGSELMLDAGVRQGGRFLELDTLEGIEAGDVLRLRDFDPARVEFVRVRALPAPQAGPALARRGLELEGGVRHAHAVGTGADVPRLPAGATRLDAPAPASPQTAGRPQWVTVVDPDALGARPGDVVVIGARWTDGRPEGGEWAEVRGVSGAQVALVPPLRTAVPAGTEVVRVLPEGGAMDAVEWLAGWIGLAPRAGRGERWNRELVRRAGDVWPVRGTRDGVQGFLDAYLRGQATATVFDPSNPMQVGLVSTVGVDTIICGGAPYTFWVDVHAEPRSMRLHTPEGMEEVTHAAQEALLREKPAHATYTLRMHAASLQIGTDPVRHVGARVGETTLLWSRPLVVAGDR